MFQNLYCDVLLTKPVDEKVKKKQSGWCPPTVFNQYVDVTTMKDLLKMCMHHFAFCYNHPPNTPTRTLLHLHLQNSAWSCWPHHWASVHTRSLSAVWRGSAQGQHHSLKGFRRGMVDCWTRGQRRVAASSEEVSLFIIEGEKRKELGDVAGERKVEASLPKLLVLTLLSRLDSKNKRCIL